MRESMKSSNAKRPRVRLLVAAISALAAISLLAGCRLPAFGEQLGDKVTFSADLPVFQEGKEKLFVAGCRWWGASLGAPPFYVDIRCNLALSNGATDAANDLHTVLRYSSSYEDKMLSYTKDKCVGGINTALFTQAIKLPTDSIWRAAIVNYINSAANQAAFRSDCASVINGLWNEVDDDTYSTGHKCVATGATFHFTSVNTPPAIRDRTLYPIHETDTSLYPGCPMERLQITIDLPGPFNTILHWGNGPNE